MPTADRSCRIADFACLVLLLGLPVGIAGCTPEVVPVTAPIPAPRSTGALVVEPASHDFGDIQQVDVLTFTFMATNTGAETLRLLEFDGT